MISPAIKFRSLWNTVWKILSQQARLLKHSANKKKRQAEKNETECLHETTTITLSANYNIARAKGQLLRRKA